ncbi:MAG: hypothetical protein JNK37_17605 [Verrucomicrobiales bacterium]|nr:hypothetical protein [Verrucomicrobiales bacterium]
MAAPFPVPLLLAGPTCCGIYDPHRGALGILDEGHGDYYGITWSDREVYILARCGGSGETILVYDRTGTDIRRLPIGRDIDGHQILHHQGHLLITATRENALIRLDPLTGGQSIWRWTDHHSDVNHINGLSPGPLGTVVVSLDNGSEHPSELVLLSPRGKLIGTLLTLTNPLHGSHNIEESRIVASAYRSVVFDTSGGIEPIPVFEREAEFFRGLGRCRLSDGSAGWLVGSSPILPRESRAEPHTAWIHLFTGSPARLLATLAVPDLGQVYEMRSLDPAFPHHGIPCPIDLNELSGIRTWKPVSVLAG